MTQQNLTIDTFLGELRKAIIRQQARRRRRLFSGLVVVVAGVTATVALGATYGPWFKSFNAFQPVTKPFPVPPFSGTDLLTGRLISNASISGRVGFILVWQNDGLCPPCKSELTAVETFAKSNPNIAVIGFDLPYDPYDAAAGRATLRQLHITGFPSINASLSMLDSLQLQGYPSLVAFNRQGKVVAIERGNGGSHAIYILMQEANQLNS